MSIYSNIFNLITTYVYGGVVLSGSFEELTAVLLSTLCCLFVIALPFILVLKFIFRWL